MKHPCRLCSLLALCFLSSLPGHADNAPSLTLPLLLEKQIQALGGPQALAVPSQAQRITGTETTGGIHGTYVTVERGLSQTWTETKLGMLDETQGSDGKTFWVKDSNGAVRLLSSEEVKRERLAHYINTYSYLFHDRLPGTVTLRPATESKTGNYILDLAVEGDLTTALYIDPHTFLLAKIVQSNGQGTVTTFLQNYKPLGGIMTATELRTTTGEKEYDDVTTVDTAENVPDVGETLFALPPSTKNYQWLRHGATSASISIETSDHRINLYVGLNGQPAYLLLDSGAGGFDLEQRAADILKLPYKGTLAVSGYGGTRASHPLVLDTLELPEEVSFSGIVGRAVETNRFTQIYPVIATVGGVGYPLLSRLITRVDIANASLTVTDPEGWKPSPQEGTALPMELEDDVPSILAQVDNLPPARFLVDTGDPDTVRLYAPYVAKNKLSEQYPKAHDSGGAGVGGSFAAKITRLASFTLGGIKMTDIPASLSVDSKGGGDPSLAGAIGMEVLERFAFTLDYTGHRIFLAPNSDAARAFDTRTFGVDVVELPDATHRDKTHFIVAAIAHDAPAYRSGLESAMVLTKIDGADVKDLGLPEVRRLLSPAGGKDTHELTAVSVTGFSGKFKVTLYDPLPPSH